MAAGLEVGSRYFMGSASLMLYSGVFSKTLLDSKGSKGQTMADYLSQLLAERSKQATRRKCFISYYSGDKDEVDQFLKDFGEVFIAKAIGVNDGDDFIDSDDSDYVMRRIREKYLGDSTVTIVMMGSCTHSRRYLDWELKSSLRQGSYTPNGLLGIILPSQGKSAHLSDRFKANWNSTNNSHGYAKYMVYPQSKDSLRSWIESVHARRNTHAKYIKNSQKMMKYNGKCKVHDKTH